MAPSPSRAGGAGAAAARRPWGPACFPPGPRAPSAPRSQHLAARLSCAPGFPGRGRLGPGAWSGGSGHQGHPGFLKEVVLDAVGLLRNRWLLLQGGGTGGGHREGVEPSRAAPGPCSQPARLSSPSRFPFPLAFLRIKYYGNTALPYSNMQLIRWCRGIGANSPLSMKTSS